MSAMHLNGGALFFALVIMHCLCDYPLQADFLAKAKNQRAPIVGIDWPIALMAHAAIHAGGVWTLTGSPLLALVEWVAHIAIDWMKCEGVTTFREDQLAHVACKALWVLAV